MPRTGEQNPNYAKLFILLTGKLSISVIIAAVYLTVTCHKDTDESVICL